MLLIIGSVVLFVLLIVWLAYGFVYRFKGDWLNVTGGVGFALCMLIAIFGPIGFFHAKERARERELRENYPTIEIVSSESDPLFRDFLDFDIRYIKNDRVCGAYFSRETDRKLVNEKCGIKVSEVNEEIEG